MTSSEIHVQEVLNNLVSATNSIKRDGIDNLDESFTAAIATAAQAQTPTQQSQEQHDQHQVNQVELERIAQEHQQTQKQGQDNQTEHSAPADENSVIHVNALDTGNSSTLATVPINAASSAPPPTKPVTGSEEWHKLRRDNHKEVERRRRENINAGINDLAAVIPNPDKNKGAILRQAVKFIQAIQEAHQKALADNKALTDIQFERERALLEKNLAQSQLHALIEENDKLKRDYESLQKEFDELEESKKRQRTEQEQQQLLQKQQQQQEQEGNHAKLPAEGSKERVALTTFRVPENLHLTHDVAIPHNIPPWTKADTDMLGTSIGYDLKTEMLHQDYSQNEDLTNKPERINFAHLARAERIYKALWNHVHPLYQSLSGQDNERENQLLEMAKAKPEVDFLLKLEKRLYPWVQYGRRSSFSLHRKFSGKGLIFCAGNGQFEFVVTTIQAIRSRLKSELPIQVFHMGEGDLSSDRQKYLRDMTSGVETVDVTQILDNNYMRLGGWAIKPFAMLASKFEEVMFIDADAYFLQDPASLFEDPGYLATGALFFFDRTLFPDQSQGSDWIKSFLPIMSSFPPTSRLFNYLTAHEQESGVVLINKRTRFTGLLSVCKMNDKWERDLHSYKVFHGDKETFWIGFEVVQDPYAFMRNYGGVIGELRPDNPQSVCGAQLHQDHQGRPLWWNGGLYRNKNAGVTRNLDFGYWMTGGGHQKHRERYTRNKEVMIELLTDLGLASSNDLELEPRDAEWDFGESCLAGAQVHTLTQREKDLANGFIAIDKIAREDGQKMYMGEKPDPKAHNWDTATL
ncbi:hypothetical protein BGZ49_006471 [Haplosporangium sp. Z 27]|nr:hypothetical protein BGZ49_006471 [Haplosporangium sp. Z 27]